jgi:hypothetical protein
VEEEREKLANEQDEQDIEAHRVRLRTDEDEASDPGRRANDDESDVEAHKFRP